MGIGMVIITSPDKAGLITEQLPEAKEIGRITELEGISRVILE
jgi:phosphoribosylaminoimidazole (AIR) synthetase